MPTQASPLRPPGSRVIVFYCVTKFRPEDVGEARSTGLPVDAMFERSLTHGDLVSAGAEVRSVFRLAAEKGNDGNWPEPG